MRSPYYNQIGRHEAGNVLAFSLPVWSTEILDTQARKAGRVKNLTLTSMKFIITEYGYSGGDGVFRVIGTPSSGTVQNSSVDVPFQSTYTLDTAAQLKAALTTEIVAWAVANSLSITSTDIVFPDFLVLATVATTGSYADLTNTPVAPSSYQTIVSQTGTAAPAVSGGFTPVNTYSGTPTFTWARSSAGVYTLTASAAVFNISGKTGVFIAPLTNLNANVRGVVTSTTVITFTSAVASVAVLGLLGLTTTPTDALLSNTMIYIQTYA